MEIEDGGYECTLICAGCGEHSFTVRYRAAGEDLIAWIEGVVRPGLAEAHKRLSPSCPVNVCGLKLPVPKGTQGVGERVLS
jgi:hypothetical protein